MSWKPWWLRISEDGRDSLVNLLDFLPDLGVAAGAALELLHRQPEPQVLVAVLLLHVGQQLLPSVRCSGGQWNYLL